MSGHRPTVEMQPSALDDELVALATVAREWLATRSPIEVVRSRLEAPPDDVSLPEFWAELVDLGWQGLAVAEEAGGQGAGLGGMCTVLEEWGRTVAPGPFPPTALVATVLGSFAPELLGPLLDGEPAAAVRGGFDEPVDGAAEARWLLVPRALVPPGIAGEDSASERWVLLDHEQFSARALPGADPTRRPARVSLRQAADPVAGFEAPAVIVDAIARLTAAAEAIGVAAWCVHTTADWARTREQFDRPIGAFQAVKHRCADSLCRLELARAAMWDAAGMDVHDEQFPLAASAAAALAPSAAFECAKDVIQVLGGIGYTWEHDAHLYLRRATMLSHMSDPVRRCRDDAVRWAVRGQRRVFAVQLPPEAEKIREQVHTEVSHLSEMPSSEWNSALADGGWLCPHWPRPWGRDSGALEQLVIDEELSAAGIRRPHLNVAGWVLPTLIAHGSPAQQQRFVAGSLRGEISWCQLFSEPGAGSDLASLSTRAVRVGAGWELTGQKVWTTLAREADFGLCLARSNPDAPKHEGITCFVVDMTTPGIDVRPLRELTGFAMFNEVFLDSVFVAEDCVVGAVDDGWRCARTTLENERVSMASGSSFGPNVLAVLELARSRGALEDAWARDLLGRLLVDSQALAALGMRSTLRAVSGDVDGTAAAVPGPEASVRKLLVVEHEQRVQEAAMSILGSEAVVDAGEGQRWFAGFLGNRALSIAGGTSEIQRNVIAERLLGLPRDP